MSDLGRALLDSARTALGKTFPDQVRASLDALTDEQIWWRANEQSNAVGNLVLHLVGSTRHFLGRGVGGSDYERDRPGEFAERRALPREELKRRLDEAVAEAGRVLDALAPERLLETTERAGGSFTLLALVLRVSHHWALHAGQIVYATKAIKAGAFDELFFKTVAR
jgi:uncharacterized damage-inducible protein DinB